MFQTSDIPIHRDAVLVSDYYLPKLCQRHFLSFGGSDFDDDSGGDFCGQ